MSLTGFADAGMIRVVLSRFREAGHLVLASAKADPRLLALAQTCLKVFDCHDGAFPPRRDSRSGGLYFVEMGFWSASTSAR
ncbi:hypothetical protein [Streptomyces sp. NBC_00453]|uniref:hypothetical protein n=1 Tax=Streptomyces sp. NBC_00453 TaxID=2903653 RepID=UPI002E1AF028